MTTGTHINRSERILTTAEWSLPLLLPWLLLFTKVLADGAVVIIGLLFLYKTLLDGNWHWAKTTWFRLGLAFWLYLLIINVPLSVDTTGSLFKALAFMRWPLFAAGLGYWLLGNPTNQKRFLVSLMIVSAFIVFDTWWQFLYGQDLFGIEKFSSDRLTGSFQKPVPGIMMLRIFFILLYIVFIFRAFQSVGRQAICALLMVVCGTLFIFITGERMAFLLFVTGSALVFIGFWLQNPKHNSLFFGGIAIVVISTIVLMFAEPDMAQRTVYSIFGKLGNFWQSDYGMVFKSAIAVWHHYPIFGSGMDTYRDVCTNLNLLAQSGMECTHAHNLYLQIAAETGLVGLGLFMVFIVSIFHTATRPFIRQRNWFMASLAFTVLYVSFWPLIGGISILNNWVAALVWTGVGWTLSMTVGKSRTLEEKAGVASGWGPDS